MELELAMIGALGGLAKSLLEQKGRVALPYLEVSDHVKYLHMGVLLNIILGLIVGGIFAKSTLDAFLLGGAAAFYLESLIEGTVINGKKEVTE